MKSYIKKEVEKLIKSDKLKTTITLKNKNDYKPNILTLAYRKFIFLIQQKIPPAKWKNALMRTTGLKIGKDVCIPHNIKFDPFFSELMTVEKGALLGGAGAYICHEVKGNKLTIGKVVIGERVLAGAVSIYKPGTIIPATSLVAMGSHIQGEVPKGELWGGQPAVLWKKFSEEDIHKYFHPSNHDKNYYKEARKQIKAFQKNKDHMFFKIDYNGDRLNAGDDWWRARNTLRIIYTSIIVEFCALLPHNPLKTFFLRLTGAKIGKNVHIGKGVVFDHFFADLFTIEDNVVLSDYCYLDGHEYTITQTIFGRIKIGKGAKIGSHVLLRSGTTVGEGAVVKDNSLVQKEVPAHEVWGGIPGKFIEKVK